MRLTEAFPHMLDVHGVTGSSPVPRTRKMSRFRKKSGFFLRFEQFLRVCVSVLLLQIALTLILTL